VAIATLETTEALRPDAKAEVAALAATGREVWILSGDEPARVAAMARSLGLPEDRAVGGCSPDDKARWIDAHDRRDTWMIGDGINDGPAVERAFCSATPTIDRPFMPSRTDAWFVTAGLRPVRLALLAATTLTRVNRRNLAVATVYNVGTVSLAFAGLMSPLLCAVVMPISSLSILLATIASLSPRRPLWRS
jgi:Cu2+-exporting ATPase